MDEAFRKGLHRNRDWLNKVDGELRGLGDLIRVCCFSRTARNVMMWAHYAAKHTGVVFQFRTSCLHDATSKEYRGQAVTYVEQALGVVEYVKALEMGFDQSQPKEMGRIIFATKGKEWQAEEEIRFFADCSRPYLSFPEVALSGIIFGDKTPSTLVEDIHRALQHWSIPPRLYRASVKDSTYRLCIRKCGSLRRL